MGSKPSESNQNSPTADQSKKTAKKPQVNIGGDVTGNVISGDNIGGDKIGGDKISGDVVITGQIAGDLQVTYVQRAPVPAPPPPLRPPQNDLFIGRENELAEYTAALDQASIAVISGMAGMGKTAVAAELARRVARPEQIFWHSFHEREGVEGLVWRLAGFLASNGQEDLWALLQNALLNNSHPPPLELQFDYLIEEVRGRNYLLCLDDFQFVHENALLKQLVNHLRQVLVAGELKVIITSREVPNFVQLATFEHLQGLSSADLGQFLAASDLFLEEEEIEQLHTYTGGNPQMLTLAIDLLHGGYETRELLDQLVETDDLEEFLMDEIESRLSRNERLVMSAVAILQGYPGSRAAIEAVLDGRRQRRVIRDLSDRFLLTVSRSEADRLYNQHAIVRDFFYETLNRREQRRMHLRAAEYYRDEERDVLPAIRHFLLGGSHSEAAVLAEDNVYLLLNQGHASTLNNLLGPIERGGLAERQWIAMQLVSGQVSSFLGDNEEAKANYLDALNELGTLQDSPETAELNARMCRGLAELLQFQAPQEALAWANKGLENAGEIDPAIEAELNIFRGALLMQSGELEEARLSFDTSLSLLPKGPGIIRARTLKNLAGLSLYTGQFEAGKAFAEDALAISRQLYDRFQESSILSNYAILQYVSGDWQRAIDGFKKAIEIALQLGIRKYIVDFEINLSVALINTGAYAQAREFLLDALPIAMELKREFNVMTIYIHLAEVHALEHAWEDAERNLAKAKDLAITLGAKTSQPAIYSIWVDVAAGRGDVRAAEAYATEALAIAQELDDPYETGIAWRAKGLAARMADEKRRAQRYLYNSIEALRDLDPFQAARSRLELGLLLVPTAEKREEGREHLEAARGTFERLGATPDLARAEEALAGLD